MKYINKLYLKLRIEVKFLLEQKWAIISPTDPTSISKKKLKKYLPSNPVIIDCGAHVGADSIEFARILPNSKIYCFEPIPSIFYNLKKATRKYSNISCFQLALGSENCEVDFYVSSGNSDASSSLLPPSGHLSSHPDVFFNEKIKVNSQTLDSWADQNNISKIDFLWLDMQGFELNMLKASVKMLNQVSIIHTEVSLSDTYEGAPLYAELREWLLQNGFIVRIEAIPKGSDMGNVFFLNKRLETI